MTGGMVFPWMSRFKFCRGAHKSGTARRDTRYLTCLLQHNAHPARYFMKKRKQQASKQTPCVHYSTSSTTDAARFRFAPRRPLPPALEEAALAGTAVAAAARRRFARRALIRLLRWSVRVWEFAYAAARAETARAGTARRAAVDPVARPAVPLPPLAAVEAEGVPPPTASPRAPD